MLLVAGAPVARAGGPFSVELDGLASYSTISPYSDAVTLFSDWVDPGNLSSPLAAALLNADNYPILGAVGEAQSFLRAYPGWREGTPGNRPVVQYQVTWDGGGVGANDQAINNLSFINFNMTGFTSTVVGGVRKNTAILPFQYDSATGEGSLALRIDNSIAGTTAAVSNLHIVPTSLINPSTGAAPVFREEFLRKVSPFKILRFMDWQQTNSGTLTDQPFTPGPFVETRPKLTWDDRPKTTTFNRTSTKGVPYEEIVALANVSKKDVWINIPDWASADYVSGMANLFKTTLDPNTTVYLEFSNELWNTNGAQRWQRVLQDAAAMTSAEGAYPAVNDGEDAGNNLRLISRMAAKRIVEFAGILKTELGTSRVKPVIAGQTPNAQYLQYGLEYLAKMKYGANIPANPDVSDLLSGIAIAPYVGNDVGTADPHILTSDPNDPEHRNIIWKDIDVSNPLEREPALDALFANLSNFVNTTLRQGIEQHKALADKYGINLDSYEGGQHLVAFNPKSVKEIQYEKDGQGNYVLDGQGNRIPRLLRDGQGNPVLDEQGQTIYLTSAGEHNSELKQYANRDPRMAMLYRQLIDLWHQTSDGRPFNQFALVSPYGPFGSWGLLEDLNQTSSAKWDTILDMLAGDANLDGTVDITDFAILEQNFNAHHALWGQADFNLDGVVDYSDFLIFRSRFQPTAPAQGALVEAFAMSVPEPGSVGAVALAAGMLFGRRRRR